MKYNPQKQRRKSIRLKGYDYSQPGLYFLTLCCQDRACLFGEVQNDDMVLNPFGKIAYTEWQKTEQIRDHAKMHEFIIMPNHLHGIIEITHQKKENLSIGTFQSPSQTIGSIIRGFKIATIKKIKDLINNSTGELGELRFAPTEFTPTEKIKALNFKLWQRNYYERIIRNEHQYHAITQYILNNPKHWSNDKLKS